MDCPILFNYGDSSVGIAAAYGWRFAFLVAGKEISSLLTFLIPPLIIEIPARGTDTLAALNQSPSITIHQASQSPLRSVMICLIDSNSDISDT